MPAPEIRRQTEQSEKSTANFTYSVNPLRNPAGTLLLYTDIYTKLRNQTGSYEIMDCSS